MKVCRGARIPQASLALALSFALLLGGCGADANEPEYNAPDSPSVTIGVAYPVKEHALDSFLANGVELAVRHVNENGGVLGKPLETLFHDDEGKADKAMQIAQSFHDTGITAVIGHWSSNVCYYVEDVYEENHVVMMTPEATSSSLFESDYSFIFRMTPNNAAYAEVLANAMKAEGKQAAAIYFSDTEYGRDLAADVSEALAARGIPVLDRVSSVTAASADRVVMRWKALGVDAVIAADDLPTLERPLKIIRGQLPEIEIYGTDNFNHANFVEIMGGSAYKMHKTTFDYEMIDPVFLRDFEDAYGVLPDNRAINGYNAVMAIAGAMSAAGSVDGEAVAKRLREPSPMPALAGDLTYNPDTREYDGFQLRVEPVAAERP
jgi:branched-chain amino acid transport system substrate-binding protein